MHLFLVAGDGDILLDMLNIGLLNILQINCNTIGKEKEEKDVKYNQNKRNTINAGDE